MNPRPGASSNYIFFARILKIPGPEYDSENQRTAGVTESLRRSRDSPGWGGP